MNARISGFRPSPTGAASLVVMLLARLVSASVVVATKHGFTFAAFHEYLNHLEDLSRYESMRDHSTVE